MEVGKNVLFLFSTSEVTYWFITSRQYYSVKIFEYFLFKTTTNLFLKPNLCITFSFLSLMIHYVIQMSYL